MSRTQTINKPAPQASRTYDYLYDPVFTLSSERDHARAMFRSNTSSNRIIRVPEFRQMFSSLQHFPNHSVRLESNDPVPRFIHRHWRGYQEQAREALKRYTKFNYDPSITVPPKQYPITEVSGRDRYRFFRRPLIPFLQQVPADIVLQNAEVNNLLTTDVDAERVSTPGIRNAMTQTDYRDSEAQTDPYTPEYVVRPGSQPELLTLATLSFGHGLPAGLAEVEMIERARAKRAWEATLPALDDLENLDKRRKMMDAQERKEWKIREEEIERLQEARLELLQKILQDRENKNAEMNTKRLEKLWLEKQKEKEKKFEKIALEHIKVMRKLALKRKGAEEKLERRDILADYTDPGSTTYAPLSRIGVFLDRGSEQYAVRSRYLTTYQGLLELEADLPDCVLKPRIQAPKPRSAAKSGFIKRKYKKQHELDVVAKELEAAERPEESLKALRFLEKIEKPIPRPPTPTVEIPCEEEEERELAVIFLQKVIRGRAIQNMMFEGKEKRFELIQELRSTHALQTAEQAVKKQEKQEILQLQRQRRLEQHKDMLINETLALIEGADLGDMLDFLNKELIRLQEERRIHAFAMLAERQRRMREAEESGRRQVEERRRREEDEIFRQVVKVNRETVDSYLEGIILGAIEDTSEEQARQEVREKAEQVNKVAYEMEKSRTRLQSEEIVAELVTSFLLPEVQRIQMRENVKQNQREGLLAAHRVVHEAIENAEKEVKASSSSSVETNELKTREEDEQ